MNLAKRFAFLGSAFCVFLVADSSDKLLAQAVQLPSFQFFTVQTTVSVPDRGAAYLGGVNRAASGRISRGIPLVGKLPGAGRLGRGEALASTVAASGVGVTATIIDHRELDDAVLAEARRGGARETASDVVAPVVVTQSDPVASVDEIRRQNEQQDQTERQEALALIEKGKQAEAAGKRSVAVIYYQMAARRADDRLREQIAAHLATLRAAELRVAAVP